MRPQGIIIRLNVQENIRLCLSVYGIMPQVNPFAFQTAEKTFGSRIIIGGTFPRHALAYMQLFQMFTIIGRSILDTPVDVENKPFLQAFPAYSLSNASIASWVLMRSENA